MTAIKLGNDYWKLTKDQVEQPIYWRPDAVSNHHVGVAGTTGAGKTHWIRTFVTNMRNCIDLTTHLHST